MSSMLVLVLVEMGTIQDGSQRYRTDILVILSIDGVGRYGHVIEEFGWRCETARCDHKDCEFPSFNSKLYESLNQQGLNSRRLVFDGTGACVEQLRKNLKAVLCIVYSEFMQRLSKDMRELSKQDDILDLAFVIATSALGGLMIKHSTAAPDVEYNAYIDFALYKDRQSTVDQLLSRYGMGFDAFRRTIYSCILCRSENFGSLDDILAVEQDGLILYPSILIGSKLERNSAFNLIVRPGMIKNESLQRYRYVREVSHRDLSQDFLSSDIESVQAFSGQQYVGLTPKRNWMSQPPEFIMRTSTREDSILVKPTLRVFPKHSSNTILSNIFSTTEGSRHSGPMKPYREIRLHHLHALENLACALVVSRPTLTPRAEEALAKRFRTVLDETVWLHLASSRRSLINRRANSIGDGGGRFIVCTDTDVELTLFQLSHSAHSSGRYVVMENGGNLVQAIQKGENAWKGGWIVIMKGN